jgi:hypothetical protein
VQAYLAQHALLPDGPWAQFYAGKRAAPSAFCAEPPFFGARLQHFLSTNWTRLARYAPGWLAVFPHSLNPRREAP